MDRAEASAVGVALVGHAALLAALTWGFAMSGNAPPLPAPMEVSFVDEVGLVSAAPEPATEPAALSTAPEVGPIEDAAPAPAPDAPRPRPQEAVPAPQPAPAQPRTARTPPKRPGTTGAGERTRRAGLGDLDPRAFGRDPSARAVQAPAAVMSTQAAADIGAAINRQVQPCADRQVYPGPGSERILTPISLSLNRDGSLRGRPRVGTQTGLDDENRRYAQRVADLAVNAFMACSPLRGLPAELYDVPRGWANFTMRYRLPD